MPVEIRLHETSATLVHPTEWTPLIAPVNRGSETNNVPAPPKPLRPTVDEVVAYARMRYDGLLRRLAD